MNVLEGLYAARASIDPGSFNASDWTRCTCGHIYAAANGTAARQHAAVTAEPSGLYEAMLRAVIDANGLSLDALDHHPAFSPLVVAVSDAMFVGALHQISTEHDDQWDNAKRSAAVLLITNAIEKLEAEQMAALLEVKAASPSLPEPREAVEA